ncbi:MAG: methyl-accepting chemotaxis protein, partial [Planctomycetota bacterium]
MSKEQKNSDRAKSLFQFGLRPRLLAISALGMITVLTVSAISLRTIGTLGHDVELAARLSTMLRNQGDADMMHDALRGDVLLAMLAESPEDFEPVLADLDAHTAKFQESFSANEAIAEEPKIAAALTKAKPDVEAYISKAKELIVLAQEDREAAKAAMPSFYESFGELEGGMEAIADILERHAEAAGAMAEHDISTARTTLFTLITVGAVVLALAGLFIARSITRPINKVIALGQHFAEGDFRGRLEPIGGGEFEQLRAALNRMGDDLSDLITRVSRSAGEVASAATEIAASSEQMAAGMERQQRQTGQVSAAVEEMASSVTEVASKAAEASAKAGGAGEQAAAGGEVVAR